MKKLLIGIVCVVLLFAVVGCNKSEENSTTVSVNTNKSKVKITEPKVFEKENENIYDNDIPYANKKVYIDNVNLPLKGNFNEADSQVSTAVTQLISEAYKDVMVDCSVYVEKLYDEVEEQNVQALREKNLGENEVAFETSINIKLMDGVDYKQIIKDDEYYNEEENSIEGIKRVGIIRYDEENGVRITDFGTKF